MGAFVCFFINGLRGHKNYDSVCYVKLVNFFFVASKKKFQQLLTMKKLCGIINLLKYFQKYFNQLCFTERKMLSLAFPLVQAAEKNGRNAIGEKQCISYFAIQTVNFGTRL